MRKIICFMLTLMLVLGICLLPGIQISADAAEFEYVYDSTGKYIYNWGTREETATYLSPMAEAFYTNNYTYDVLSAHAGGTGTSDAPNSKLYKELQTLMKSKHTYETSYNATRDLYQYTDCENSGLDSKVISSFYSGDPIGPAWDSGSTWNREHTWPNSKGLAGNDENDIMMLRPTASSENGSRGNKAYGKSNGYYNPNMESGGEHDVRGDVARIFLYVYVRWGNVNGNGQYSTWGSNGVMESLEVLLEWMAADPVDTWELGRNDSVQAITGTRNVFVDYPELAFLLFGAEMPSDMMTPSGEGSQNCGHNNFGTGVVTAPTCTTSGYTTYTCKTSGCGYSYKANAVAATGHSYTNGSCTACGEAEPASPNYGMVEAPVVGTAYKFGMIQQNVSTTSVYYLKGGMSGYYMATTTNKDEAIDVYLENTTGGYYLYTYVSGVKTYINMVVSGTHVNGAYEATASTVYTYDTTNKTLIAQVNGDPYWFGTRNDNTYTTVGPCKTSYNGFYCQFYGELSGGADCKHTNTRVEGAVEATCVKPGHTGKTVCADCGETVSAGSATNVKAHNYVGGVCTGCGKGESAPDAAVLDFSNEGNRVSQDGNQQIWQANGITLTNNKDKSTVAIANYYNPVRLYANTSVTIAYENMIKLVITCPTSAYAEALINSVSASYSGIETSYEMGSSGAVVTIELAEATDSITFSISKQTRINDMVVYAETFGEVTPPACQHTNTKVEGAVNATCAQPGHTGKTVCTACGEEISAGTVIPATGEHSYIDGICSVCGQSSGETPVPPCAHENTKVEDALEATCGEAGHTGKTVCVDCGEVTSEGSVIPATGEHNYGEDHKCTGCGEMDPSQDNPCSHTALETRDQVEATCSQEGYTGNVYCTECGEKVEEGSVIATNDVHNYGDWETIKKPSLKGEGTQTRTCAGCGDAQQEAIPAKIQGAYVMICATVLAVAAAMIWILTGKKNS